MKLPGYILVCGTLYKVLKDPSYSGGSFSVEKRVICIGTRVPHAVPMIFLHEVSELVYAIRNMRYVRQVADPDNGDYIFHYNHEEHHHAIADIAAALRGIRF